MLYFLFQPLVNIKVMTTGSAVGHSVAVIRLHITFHCIFVSQYVKKYVGRPNGHPGSCLLYSVVFETLKCAVLLLSTNYCGCMKNQI